MSRVGTVNFSEEVHNDTMVLKEWRFFESDGTTPLDLSDVTPKIQIRMCTPNGRLVRTCVIGDGIEWVSQPNGTFQWGGFVMNWPEAGYYHYDLQFTYNTSGIIRTYIKGVIRLMDDVTV